MQLKNKSTASAGPTLPWGPFLQIHLPGQYEASGRTVDNTEFNPYLLNHQKHDEGGASPSSGSDNDRVLSTVPATAVASGPPGPRLIKQVHRTAVQRSRQGRVESVRSASAVVSGRAVRDRHNRLFLTVFAVSLLTLIFGLLLLNQSRIISLTFSNAALADQIERVNVSNVQNRSALAARTDLSQIREKATALGLVEPNQQQIRQVIIPQEDELKIYSGR